MPFEGEFATGESLLSLEQSAAFREFKGVVRPRGDQPPMLPTPLKVERNDWRPQRVIAIDGSHLSVPVQNGFPMAEIGLMKVAVISIDLGKLLDAQAEDIPSPRVFYDMERAFPFDHVLPGANILRRDVPDDTPKRYFRQTAFDAFHGGRLDKSHETLLQTVRAIRGGPHTPARPAKCPVEDCDEDFVPCIEAVACSSSGRRSLMPAMDVRHSLHPILFLMRGRR